jgi:hypothetical protein
MCDYVIAIRLTPVNPTQIRSRHLYTKSSAAATLQSDTENNESDDNDCLVITLHQLKQFEHATDTD